MTPETATIIVATIGGIFTLCGIYLAHILNKVKKRVDKSEIEFKRWLRVFRHKRTPILILDNDPQDLELTERVLRKDGHDPETFENEEELKDRVKQEKQPIILILDHFLTKTSGVEIVKYLRTLKYDHIIIVLSGFKNENILFNYSNAGIDKFVFKNDPDYLEQIKMYVNEAVEKIANL